MKKFSLAFGDGAFLVCETGAAQGPNWNLTLKRPSEGSSASGAGDCALGMDSVHAT